MCFETIRFYTKQLPIIIYYQNHQGERNEFNPSYKEIRKLLSEFKTKVEQAELGFQNTPFLLDGGIRINPDY